MRDYISCERVLVFNVEHFQSGEYCLPLDHLLKLFFYPLFMLIQSYGWPIQSTFCSILSSLVLFCLSSVGLTLLVTAKTVFLVWALQKVILLADIQLAFGHKSARLLTTSWAIKRSQLIFVCNFVKINGLLMQFSLSDFKNECDGMNFTHLT